jgi:hypothetical protein
MAHHLSIFMENKPGKLDKVIGLLSDSGINLRAVSMASTGSFGIIKLLVTEPDRASDILQKAGVAVYRRKIIIAVVDDRPGGLHGLLRTLSSHDINLEDCYGFVIESGRRAAVVLEIEKFPEAETILLQAGVRTLKDEEIYSL